MWVRGQKHDCYGSNMSVLFYGLNKFKYTYFYSADGDGDDGDHDGDGSDHDGDGGDHDGDGGDHDGSSALACRSVATVVLLFVAVLTRLFALS